MQRFTLFFSYKIYNVIRLCYEVILLFYILFSQYNPHSRVGPIGPLEIHHADVLFFAHTCIVISELAIFLSSDQFVLFILVSSIFLAETPARRSLEKNIPDSICSEKLSLKCLNSSVSFQKLVIYSLRNKYICLIRMGNYIHT